MRERESDGFGCGSTYLDDIKTGDVQTSRIAYVLKPDALFVISI